MQVICINSDEGAEYFLLELGKLLGFDPYTVDSVIWFGDDGNPTCLEVDHTTDIVQRLDKLIQLQNVYTKFFVVTPEEKITRYEELLASEYPPQFRDRLKFISYDELVQFFKINFLK